jgi:hypothetical protein
MALRELLNLDEKGLAGMAIQVPSDLDLPNDLTRVIEWRLIQGL